MANKTVTVKSSGGDYTSLNAALAGESANLVANTCILTIECYAFEDTTAASTGTGYTTNASYYINITVPTAERHTGKWDTSKYRINLNVNWINGTLDVLADYTRVNGVQGKNISVNTSAGFYINASNVRLINCIANECGTRGFYMYGGTTGYIINCLATHNTGGGFDNGGSTNLYAYNCVAVNNATGFVASNWGNVIAKNCYSGGNSTADYHYIRYPEFMVKTTCHSSDTTGNTQTAFSTSSGTYFTNVTAGSEDLHIGASSALIGAATNLYNDATYPFQTDIIGTDRGGAAAAWDVGAFEYVAAAAGDLSITASECIGANMCY